MALPPSGEMNFQRILQELGREGPMTFDDVDVRRLAGKMSGEISLSDFYGKMLQNDFAWTSPGTYSFTVPEGVTKIAAYVEGGAGGGGGGGGAGEMQWTPSASGGGGGSGGGGQKVVQILDVTPGQVLSIIVGDGGAGGAGGDGAWSGGRYWGASGTSGANGVASMIVNLVTASGGAGGLGGKGGDGDAPWNLSPGGSGGAGWPAGDPGKYNHIPGINEIAPNGDSYQNIEHGPGGIGPNGGNGGNGGDWGNLGWENYSPYHIGDAGLKGGSGRVSFRLGTTVSPIDPATLPVYQPYASSVAWPTRDTSTSSGGGGGGTGTTQQAY